MSVPSLAVELCEAKHFALRHCRQEGRRSEVSWEPGGMEPRAEQGGDRRDFRKMRGRCQRRTRRGERRVASVLVTRASI